MLTVITAGALMFLSILFIVLAIKKHKSTGKAPMALIALALIFIVTLAIVPFSIHVVNTGEVAVVKEFGEAKEIKTAGMHFDLWFIAQYDYYDAKVQNVELKTSAYSSDAQTMNISMTLQFHISTEHAIDIARQYGNLDALQSRIEAIAIEKTKSVLSSYKAMDIISDRASMSPRVEDAIKKAITDEYFVTVSTVVLTNIDFSEAFEKAVEEKMIAEQKKLQAEYENEMKVAAAEAEAQAAIQKADIQGFMAAMTRKEAREEAFRLLFETEFRANEMPEDIYALSTDNREVSENAYIKTVYFGVREHLEEIDAIIVNHSKGWKPERITPVSRSAIRLCIYEMLYMKDIPMAVSLNEAIELVKKYDDGKVRAFVNGVLNGAKEEIEAKQSNG